MSSPTNVVEIPWYNYTEPFSHVDMDTDLGSRALARKAIAERKTLHHMFDVDGYVDSLDKSREFFERLQTEMGAIRISNQMNPETGEDDPNTIFAWDDGICHIKVHISNGVTLRAYFVGRSRAEQVLSLYKEYVFYPEIEPLGGSVHTLLKRDPNSPVELYRLGFIHKPLERGNYTPEVLAAYDAINRDLRSTTPRGRISIIDGPPGTGKTFLVRALISENPQFTFVLVPPKFLAELSNPEMLPALMRVRDDRNPLVLVLEDADEILARRMSRNIDSIMATLNMGDGIIGDLLNFRIIATTNVEIEEIDPAIMRPGRLSQRIQVGELDGYTAFKVLHRLMSECGKPLGDMDSDLTRQQLEDRTMTLAEVYSMARDLGWESAALASEDEDDYYEDDD